MATVARAMDDDYNAKHEPGKTIQNWMERQDQRFQRLLGEIPENSTELVRQHELSGRLDDLLRELESRHRFLTPEEFRFVVDCWDPDQEIESRHVEKLAGILRHCQELTVHPENAKYTKEKHDLG